MTAETTYEAASRLFPTLRWERIEMWVQCIVGPLRLELKHVHRWQFTVERRDLDGVEWASIWCATPDEAARLTRQWLIENGEAMLALAEVPAPPIAESRSGEWTAVYGAFVSAQVMERMRAGFGPPDTDDQWDCIVEEAEAVANLAAEAMQRRRAAHTKEMTP